MAVFGCMYFVPDTAAGLSTQLAVSTCMGLKKNVQRMPSRVHEGRAAWLVYFVAMSKILLK